MATYPPFMPGLPGVQLFNDFSGLYRPTASNADLDRLYSTSVAVYAAANFWGGTASLVKWRVVDANKQDIDPATPEVQALRHNMPDMLHRSMISEKFRGYNLLYKERHPMSRRTFRLRWMNFNMYELDEHFQSGLRGFRVMQGGTNYAPIYTDYIQRGDGIYWNLIDLQDDFDGVAAAEVAFMYAGVDVEAGTTMLAYFQNMAIPALVIQPAADAKNAPQEREVDDLRTLLRKIVRGAMNFGRTIVTPARWEFQQLQSKMEELKMGELIGTARESVRIAMDVPKFVLSDEGTSYAESYEERRQWLNLSFVPRMNKIGRYFEDQLIKPVNSSWTVEADYSDVPGMKEEAERLTTTVAAQVNTITLDLYAAQEKLGIEPKPELKDIFIVQGVPVPLAEIPKFYANMQAQGGLGGAAPTPPGFGGGAPTGAMPAGDNAQGAAPAMPVGTASATKDAATQSAAVMLKIGAHPDLIGLQQQVRALCQGQTVEWSDPQTFHVTLCSFPALTGEQLTKLRAYVMSMDVEPVPLRIGSLGTFDNLGQYAIRFMLRQAGALEPLKDALCQYCQDNDIPLGHHYQPDVKYKPHITMGYSNVNPGRLTYDTPLTVTPTALQLGIDDTIAYERPLNAPGMKSVAPEPEELWLDDLEFKELKTWRVLMARKGIDYAFAPNVLPPESIAFGVGLLKQGYGVEAAGEAMKAHIVGQKKINMELLAKAFDESQVNRDDDGKFSSGGGGGGGGAKPAESDKKPKEKKPKPDWKETHPKIAQDDNGQPEWLMKDTYPPQTYRNPAYEGPQTGKQPTFAPTAQEAGVSKPVAKPAAKPAETPKPAAPEPKPETPKPAAETPKPAADTPKAPPTKPGKKPEWVNKKKPKPGVDGEGYMDYNGMDDTPSATNQAYELSDSHTSKLNKKQIDAAQTYTGNDYSDINGGLRSGKVPRQYETTVRNLDSAIDQSRLPDNTVLYRGMNMSPDMAANMKPGAVFSDKAYTSTSINPRIPESFARGEGKTLMRIKARAGSKGLAVNNISNFDGEHEILLPRGSRYKVTGMYKDKRTGMTYIDAEILGDND